MEVTIEPSDNPAGVFSFITASLTLSRDGPSEGELEVRRVSGLSGSVMIEWEALFTDGMNHSLDISAILVNTRGAITFEDNSPTPVTNIQLQLQAEVSLDYPYL